MPAGPGPAACNPFSVYLDDSHLFTCADGLIVTH